MKRLHSITGSDTSFRVSVFLALTIFVSVGCGPAWGGWGEWDGEVIALVTSPDSAVEAIVVEGSLGATTGFSSRVYIVSAGTEFDKKAEAFADGREILRADSVDGLALKWTDPKTLQISFRSARIFHYTNFADDMESGQKVGRYDIKLVEHQ